MDLSKLQGWVDDQDEVATVVGMQNFRVVGDAIRTNSQPGLGKGKNSLLYEYLYRARGGTTPDFYNYRVQTIGDCVSFGAARALDILIALMVAEGLATWEEVATEPIYALGRVEVGGGRLGGRDGCVGAWAAEALKRFGFLFKKKYGKYDFTTYDGNKARAMGMPRAGLPDELEPEARQRLVNEIALVTTWEELCDVTAGGAPTTIASNCGFDSQQRDQEGFIRPSGTWNHQMCVIGTIDIGPRPGAVVAQSWPKNWVRGPLGKYNIPHDAFLVDADVMEKRILRQQDSWALSRLTGFEPQKFLLGSALFND